MNIWQQLPKPIISLAPMDGVTDQVFRQIVDLYGKAPIFITEFVPVEALKAGAVRVLEAFVRHKSNTPTIAQIYGSDPDSFYLATLIVCELGFDGVDINMGCPAKSVTSRGAGAGLIRNPALAKRIISTTKQALLDWQDGAYLSAKISQSIRDKVNTIKTNNQSKVIIPISIKTRIGYDDIATDTWIPEIASADIAAITIHGRTLKQGYGGKANWDQIAKASDLVHNLNKHAVVLGNGDVESYSQGLEYCTQYHVDGVLIGRKALGNPWIFSKEVPTQEQRIQVAIKHAQIQREEYGERNYVRIRKHLAWYCQGFKHSAELRNNLLKVNTYEDVVRLLTTVTT